MRQKTWANLLLIVICALITSMWTCAIPSDPSSPSNTRLSIVLQSGTLSSEGEGTFSDTLGVTLRVGIAIDLTQNVESARLSIECTNPDFDTTVLLSDFSSLDITDTIWHSYTYQDTGKIVIHTEMDVHGWETVTDSVMLTVYARTNNAPRLIVSGERTVEAGMPCSLSFGANDPDAGQKLTFSVDSLPEGAEFDTADNFFRWTPEPTDTGTHQFIITAVDNGFPPLSDEDTVMVTVTPAKEYHAPEWESDTMQKRIQAGTLLEIDLTEICSDADGDSIAFALIEGDPSDDAVTTGTYSWEPVEEDTGTFYVTIIAEDPSSMTDTVVIELTVSLQDVTPPSLTLVSPDDSSVTATDTVTVTVTGKDFSGVEYVRCTVGSDTFEVNSDDTLYTATVTGLQGGEYTTIMFAAADASDNHNAAALLVYIKYDDDTDVPEIARVSPDKDSVSTNSSSYTITLACDDASGIESVVGTRGEATFSGSSDTENKWVITVEDLEEGVFNEVTVTVTDASLQKNVTSVTLYIMYDPTMDDVDGPTLQRVSGLASGDIVTSDVIARVDSIYDPSGIDSVYWIVGGKVKIMTPVTTSETGGTYALQDTLRRYHLDTLEVVAVDASTAHNRTSKLVVVDFNVPPVVRDTAIATYLATAVTVTPAVTSADDDDVTLRIIGDPEHGTAEVDGAELTYTPEDGWNGVDSFDVEVSDGVWSDTMRVKVTVAPTYTLTVNRTATGGTVAVEKDTAAYYAGDEVTLTATPAANYRFAGWRGDTTATENPLKITVRKDWSITAKYIRQGTLTFSSSDPDQGTVSSDAGESPVTVDSGTVVTLTASPMAGYRFTGWSGGSTAITSTLSVTVTKNSTISANFVKTYAVTAAPSGSVKGSVTIDAGASPVTVDSGTVVEITASAKPEYRFTGWSGDATTETNPLSTTVQKNTSVTANYIKTYTLTLEPSDNTNGTVALPAGTSPMTVDSGVAVAIKATAADGYTFKEWIATGSGVNFENLTQDSTTVTLNGGNATVTGVFGRITFSRQLTLAQYTDAVLVDGVELAEGGYMLVGRTDDKTLLVKLNEFGDTVWTKTNAIPALPNSISKVSATSYLVAGASSDKAAYSVFSRTGDRLAYKELYSTGYPTWNAVRGMATKDGGYIIAAKDGSSYRLVKITANASVWDSTYDVSLGTPYDCTPTRDGGYIVVGNGAMTAMPMAIKTDADGGKEWRSSFSSTLSTLSYTQLRSVDTTSDGGCVIVGMGTEGNPGESSPKGFMVKIALDGTVENDTYLSFADASELIGVKALPDGDYFIAGTTLLQTIGGDDDIYIARVTSSGEVLHKSVFGGADKEGAMSLQLTADGGAIVIGTGNRVIKTDENGQVD